MGSSRSASRCPGSLPAPRTRREFLRTTSTGFGWLALAGLLADEAEAAAGGSSPLPHHPPRAKHVIFCFMDGGPSHVDTFDYKPELARHEGEQIGEQSVTKLAQSGADRVWLGCPWEFKQRGESGLWVSDLLPHLAECADDLCVVRSLIGKQPLHGQQNLLTHTGRVTGGAPSLGSWISYGLGSENRNLPSYVLLHDDRVPNGGVENFASAFLPATHGATMLRARGEPVDNIVPHDDLAVQRRKLALLQDQDGEFAADNTQAALIEAAIRNYETAFRMQSAVPGLADVAQETEATQRQYGLDSQNEHQKYYGLQCLRARRLIEAGVRFVEVTCPLTRVDPNNAPWDQHGYLKQHHEENALYTDQAVTALIRDLKQRGLLDETVVIWGGEMGRTPHTPKINKICGRDHHVDGYTIFMAGGGFRGGQAYGVTDELGNTVVEHPLDIHDIHATILHQLGIDHRRLTFRYGGRDVSLTDVHGRVVRDLIG